jgi:TetR/AcrR family transcriptional repressor of bet genes
MARPSNTDERRRQIVAALQRVMAERGYEGATIAEIARAADLSPGLLHYHFANKQEILVALVGRLAERVQARFAERVDGGTGEPRKRLQAFLDALLAVGAGGADRDALACWVTIGAEAVRLREVRDAYSHAVREQLAMLDQLVRAVLVREGRSTARVRELSAGLLAAVEGAYQLATVVPGTVPEGAAAAALRRMAEGLLAAEPQRRPPAPPLRESPSESRPDRRRG